MKTIKLNRVAREGKAVRGIMTFELQDNLEQPVTRTCDTIENADFIIPAGTYPIERTWSPKFKKCFPEILEVPDRTGIRIHKGSLPEHSQGCVLTDMIGMSRLNIFFNILDEKEDEKACIEITEEFAA